MGGKYTDKFTPYVSKIGVESLVGDDSFISLLKESASDPMMQHAQEAAYDSMYIDPAYGFCDKHGIKLGLSKLVICDSYLHSGSVPNIVRNMFSAKLPVDGGDEKTFTHLHYLKRE